MPRLHPSCECGCGGIVTIGKRFLHGHNAIGRKLTQSTLDKLREINIGRKHSDASIIKIKAARAKQTPPNLGRKFSTEWRDKIKEAKTGEKNHNYGKKFSTSHCAGIAAGKLGEKNPQWNGGRIENDGYILIRVYDHPKVNKSGYIGEHILIIEKHIGRYLTNDEIVHHKNSKRSDNKIENLQLCDNQSEHMKLHDTFRNRR